MGLPVPAFAPAVFTLAGGTDGVERPHKPHKPYVGSLRLTDLVTADARYLLGNLISSGRSRSAELGAIRGNFRTRNIVLVIVTMQGGCDVDSA